jgi:DNA polymerase-3 subunit beta
MKFKIKKSEIIDTLSKVQGLTGRRTNLAITSNLLIQSTDSGISITASDLDTIFEGYFPAEIESEGSIALNARKLFEITRDFPSDVILIDELEPQWIEIKDDHVEYHIVGMNPDDFPDRPHIEDIEFFTIPSTIFKNMIEKTTFIGFPRDEKRAHMIGIYFERIEDDHGRKIRMVSTDARRLSKVDYLFSEDIDLPSFENVLIPKAGLNEVNRFLNTQCDLQIGLKSNFFIVKKGDEIITISLLEGEFPDYHNLIKTEAVYSLRLNRYLFLMMLKRMSILSSEANKSVVFNLENEKLVMTATNPDIGESREEMEIEYAREPIEVAFIETLNSIDEEEILLYIRDAQSPCLIEGTDDKRFLSVIMPMKI